MPAPRPPRAPRKSPRNASSRRPAAPPRRRFSWRAELAVVLAGLATGLLLAGAVLFVDARVKVRAWLADPPRSTPTTVWSAPITVRAGDPYPLRDLVADLLAAGLERAEKADRPGRFAVDGSTVVARLPAREGPGFRLREGTVRIVLSDDHVARTEPADGVTLPPTVMGVIGDREGHRTPVRLDAISPWIAPALLAIEDARFHHHVGVDPVGLARAVVRTIVFGDTQGGSTLTQQLAKNLFVGPERSVRRKVRELFHAAALEAELDKDQLLELYLSEVYLGHVGGVPIHGVEQGARAFFGKSAASLTVSEAATIAGTIASPNAWSPLRPDHEATRARRDQVIRRMVEVRALTQAQAEEALDDPIVTVAAPSAAWRLPWAVAAALDEAGALDGEGLEVWTTVQPHLQRAAERAARRGLDEVAAKEPTAAAAEVAVVTLDARTGAVLAIVGGRDWARSPFHRALHARRQAGSTVKPLLVLEAMARDPSLSPSSLFEDEPLERRLDGKVWRPKNYDGAFLGPMTLQRALETSRNVPAVLLSERVGLERLRDALHRAGLEGATAYPSTALGAFPTTTMELAGAYAAFPGGGLARRAHVLAAVTGPDGKARTRVQPEAVRLADPVTAAIVTSMLRGVTTHGTARGAKLPEGFGGKTGTTDGGRDAWFVGFDAERVTAVWVGLDRGTLGLGGGEAALPVWKAVVLDAGGPRGRLPRPDDVETAEVCVRDGRPPCGDCPEVRTWWFRAGRVPAADCAVPDTPEASPEVSREAPAPPRSVRMERVRRGP